MDTLVFQNVIIAIALGLLVGLQREMHLIYANRQKDFGGARTFALISLSGYLCAWLNHSITFFLPIATIVLGAFLISAYVLNRTPNETGMTTEFSAFAIFLIGALLAYERAMLAVFITISILFVLNLKEKIQAYEKIIAKQELSAAILFLTMSLVILPMVPNKTLDPWGYFNLYQIGLMVVLVAGISFLGYIAVRIVGIKHGIGLMGLFGGIVSSTAVTLSLSRRSHESPLLTKNLAIGINLACSIMLLRLLVEMYVLYPALATRMILPTLGASLVGYLFLGYLYVTSRKETIVQTTVFKNPFRLSEALLLGLLFGAVLALIQFFHTHFGNSGVYVVSFISGLADTDAIALSLATLAHNELAHETALRALILAMFANSFIKFGITLFLGNASLARYVGTYLALNMITFASLYFYF